MTRARRTLLTVACLLAVLVVMGGITSYSVTLYRLFCAATGANGTTQRVAENDTVQTAIPAGRMVSVFFDTSVAPGLPWRFVPLQRSVKLRLGEDSLAFFEARNLSDHAIVGHATFNVSPEKAGLYFKKIQCFCFNEERLAAGQTVQMPVTFFVDPRIADDPGTADVHEITLSYTFFESRRPAEALDLARFTPGAPEAKAGAQIFAADCAGCHSVDPGAGGATIGPRLGDVMGRAAGSVAGYPYSKALAAAKFTWTPQTLDRWLAGPQDFLAGAQMPMRLDRAADRQAVIAYLESLPKSPG